MKINMIKVPVKELIQGYSEDDQTSRVRAWGGKLDVRPEYQREYVYSDDKRDAVINTILKGFPLNIMYFVDRKDGTYEVLDGQQRIISICRYATNKFSVKIPSASGGFNTVNRPNLFDEDAERFEDYELQVYICEGTDKENGGRRAGSRAVFNQMHRQADAVHLFAFIGNNLDQVFPILVR